MEEEWRQIPEAINYEVSNLQRVRNRKTGRILKQRKVGNVYTVSLMDAGYHLCRSVQLLETRAFAD
jgi:hypothetical protein